MCFSHKRVRSVRLYTDGLGTSPLRPERLDVCCGGGSSIGQDNLGPTRNRSRSLTNRLVLTQDQLRSSHAREKRSEFRGRDLRSDQVRQRVLITLTTGDQ